MSIASARRTWKRGQRDGAAFAAVERLQLFEGLRQAVSRGREAQVLCEFVTARSGAASMVVVARESGWRVEGQSGAPLPGGLVFGAHVELGLVAGTTRGRWHFVELRHGSRLVARLAVAAPATSAIDDACAMAAPFLAASSGAPPVADGAALLSALAPVAPRAGAGRAILPPAAPGDEAIDVAAMLAEIVERQRRGDRLRLEALSSSVVAAPRPPLQRALSEVVEDAIARTRGQGVVRIVVGEVASALFVELAGDRTMVRGLSAGAIIARAVLEALGGSLRLIEGGRRMLLVHLPLAHRA